MTMIRRNILAYLILHISSLTYAADTFDIGTSVLTVPSIAIGSIQYANLVATLGPFTVVGAEASLPITPGVDVYDARTNVLTIPEVLVGNTTIKNVQLRLGGVTVNSLGPSKAVYEIPPMPAP